VPTTEFFWKLVVTYQSVCS